MVASAGAMVEQVAGDELVGEEGFESGLIKTHDGGSGMASVKAIGVKYEAGPKELC